MADPARSARPPSLARGFIFLLKTSRPGFWLTAIWFYLLPVSQQHVFGSSRFWIGILFVTFPFGLLIYGWNDIMDAEIDRLNARKDTFLFGARGTKDQLRKLPWFIAATQIAFAMLFVQLEGWRMLVWYSALVGAVAIYNWPRIGFKNFPVVDMVNQLGYLLVFWLSSTLNQLPPLPWQTCVFGGLFAMHSHVLGEIMDVDIDREGGRRTTAVVVGVTPSKCIIAAFLIFESWLILHFFRDPVVGWFLLLGALWFVVDAFVLFKSRAYPLWLTRWFLTGWNLMAIGSGWWVWSTGALSRLR
ncbi:MAG: hypothetical protein JWM16_5972 [Verrucomicrobiales bacterium]|nr:hypothetical protein [Verrucomicrobiales bacterium]